MRVPTLVGLAAAATLIGASLAPASAARISGPQMPAGVHGGQAFQRGVIPPMILKSQLHAFKPNVLPKSVQQRMVGRHVQLPAGMRPGLHYNGGAQLFIADDFGYIFQMNSKGTKIKGYTTDCSGAEGSKVDGSGNLWVACTNTSTVNMYSPAKHIGTATMVLNDTIAGVPYYTADVAVGGDGTVYASSLYAFSCTTYYCYFYPGQVSYWLPGNVCNGCTPSGQVLDPNINEEGFFLDVDASNNLYVDYFGCNANFTFCGYGFDEISNPTGSPSVFSIVGVTSGTIAFPGGVQVLNDGTPTLLDQLNDTVTKYVGNTGTLWLTVTQNLLGSCDPVSNGLNSGETSMAIGDAGCRSADIGDTAADTWKLNANVNFGTPIGAAYNPSNK